MLEQSKVSVAIQANDQATLDILINKSTQDPDSLREFLQHLLVHSAASQQFHWHPELGWVHPTVILNSVKNICGLKLDNPSLPLLNYAVEIARDAQSSPRDSDWRKVSEKERIKPLFVMDFRQALANRDIDSALSEAAKMLLMSDNKSYVLEIICDSLLDQFDAFGLLTYSFYRSAAFCPKADAHYFVSSLIEFILGPESISKSNLEERTIHPILFAAVQRLQSSESVLQSSFLKLGELNSPDFSENGGGGNGTGLNKKPVKDIVTAWKSGNPETLGMMIKGEAKSGDNSWPVTLAEARLIEGEDMSPFWLVALDAVQYLVREGSGWSMTDLSGLLMKEETIIETEE